MPVMYPVPLVSSCFQWTNKCRKRDGRGEGIHDWFEKSINAIPLCSCASPWRFLSFWCLLDLNNKATLHKGNRGEDCWWIVMKPLGFNREATQRDWGRRRERGVLIDLNKESLLSCPLGLGFVCFIREWSDPYHKIGFGEGQTPYKNIRFCW